ncbi:unnamed protein product [Notodromas monacha]|uniref:Innexin n=1 Tax=Notodromas monacha TaxID=399045 RepID=A0A7R9BVN5_9CRUS|nr:unnamed protein product [Notodromas monacha]CAG0921254.1 unnamed protein product [Notodromas monacha]
MFELLSSLGSWVKRQEITTDNAVFRLHYMFTALLLLCFSAIITASQFIGDPIECMGDKSIPGNVRMIELESSFGLVNPAGHEDEKKYYTYYQWVVFVLFLQAMLCYFPKWLWDMWESNLLSTIVVGLNYGMITEEEKESKKKTLIDYMLKHIKHHNMYAIKYFFCEVLCLINIIGQMYLMNAFFDGEFMQYGRKVTDFSDMDQDNRIDPMVYVFPRITKCTFHKFGPSGTIMRSDFLCVLPLNIFNEKSFVFLWFWYIIIATLLSALVLFRIAIIALPSTRAHIFHFYNRIISKDTAAAISRKTSLGDWWVMFMLGSNMDPLIYREVMSELAKKIEISSSNSL